MPIKWLVNYWSKAADYSLNFLKGRKVAVEQKFKDKVVYRRHKGKRSWIRISSREEIINWARKHTYSFHPHIKGEDDFWFVMDIDRKAKSFSWQKMIRLTYQMAEIFEGYNMKYLLKYSGNRGFHFMFEITDIKRRSFKKEQKLIQKLRDELEKRQKNKKPVTTTSSKDKQAPVLIDKGIVHKKGSIRSPYSVHPKTELVSAPIRPKSLKDFKRKKFKPKNVELKKVKLPSNSWELVKKILY